MRRSLNACSLPTCIKSSRSSSARPRQMAGGSRPGGEFQHGSADCLSQARDREASPPSTPASTNLVHDYKHMSTRGTHQPTLIMQVHQTHSFKAWFEEFRDVRARLHTGSN